MSDVVLGKLIDENAQRDAIHVAIAPVVAAERLVAGDHIGLDSRGLATERTQHIGIVDPFIKLTVQPGERFYMFLYPNTVTGMRHQWSHPAFPIDNHSQSESEAWIRKFAEGINQTFDSLMSDAEAYAEFGSHKYDNSESYTDPRFGSWEDFWKHYTRLTGKSVDCDDGTPYTCSC